MDGNGAAGKRHQTFDASRLGPVSAFCSTGFSLCSCFVADAFRGGHCFLRPSSVCVGSYVSRQRKASVHSGYGRAAPRSAQKHCGFIR